MQKINNEKIYDLIIIGSGTAGLSAAVYAQRAMLDTVVIEKAPFSGGQVITIPEIENYLSYSNVSGYELMEKSREHAQKLGAVFLEAEVLSIEKENNVFSLKLDKTELYTKSIIVATGAESKKLGVLGEEKFSGRGVSFCASCDAAFYRGKTVAIAGGGDTAFTDAVLLARQCEKVYIVHRSENFRAAKALQEKIKSLENVSIITDAIIKEIQGEGKVSGIVYEKNNEEIILPCDGIFIAIGIVPNSGAFKDIMQTDNSGFIISDETGKTSENGIFAAGDIRAKALRQIITAASDGANAVYSVEKYLSQL